MNREQRRNQFLLAGHLFRAVQAVRASSTHADSLDAQRKVEQASKALYAFHESCIIDARRQGKPSCDATSEAGPMSTAPGESSPKSGVNGTGAKRRGRSKLGPTNVPIASTGI